MGYEQSVSSQKRLLGLLLVVAFHIVLIYALMNGLAQKIVMTVIDPLEVKIIEQVKLPPPPPPPPKDTPPPPKAIKPPPAYVPPAEVKVESKNQDTIAAVTNQEPPPSAPIPAPIPAPIEPAKAAPEPAPPPQKPKERTKATAIMTSCAKPTYPAESQELEEEGSVKLSFFVDTEGSVTESKVIKSSGFTRLDDAARQAFSQCKFNPGTVDGVPEKTWANVEYQFKL